MFLWKLELDYFKKSQNIIRTYISGFCYFYLMQITAIILAGGKSKRMGTDKTFLELDGVPLLQRMISLLQPLCETLIISSNNPRHEKYGYNVIADEIKNCGPIGGIYSSINKSNTDLNFVISVDAAFIEKDFVEFLISKKGDYDAVVPYSEKGKEPLIALYNKSCLPFMKEKLETGDYKMHTFLSTVNTKWIDAQSWVEKYPKLFHNLNRPEDL